MGNSFAQNDNFGEHFIYETAPLVLLSLQDYKCSVAVSMQDWYKCTLCISAQDWYNCNINISNQDTYLYVVIWK